MDEKVLKDAQYRKGLSIAYFNSLNAAIELVTNVLPPDASETAIRDQVTRWREWFLEEHKNYYATVIAKVGTVYKAEATIELLKATIDREHLKNLWQSISEDERHDPEIRKVALEMKKKHEKA